MKSTVLLTTSLILCSLTFAQTNNADVVQDNTLGTNVQVSGSTFNILGGTINNEGTVLFHSFTDFSLSSSQSAIFANNPTLDQIFARVTGGNSSIIDGLIQVQGNTDLFLINPNGINFNNNASLNVGGSFIATTGSSIQFDNGFLFSATPQDTAALLTVRSPQQIFFNNPGTITNTTYTSRLLTATNDNPAGQKGLYVSTNNTLALLGGTINFTRGAVEAAAGNLELGAVQHGSVRITPDTAGWSFDYTDVLNFADITLDDQSWLISFSNIVFGENFDSSSTNPNNSVNGSISLWGDDITFANSTSVPFFTFSDTQNGGDFVLNANNFSLTNGSTIYSLAFGKGDAGDININVAQTLQMIGNNLNEAQVLNAFQVPTSIYDRTTGKGNSGTISITTQNLSILNGAQISVSTYRAGNSGNIEVNAKNISIDGLDDFASAIFAQTNADATGNGGAVTINTDVLNIVNGGTISANSFSKVGNAGTLQINASESLFIAGTAIDSDNEITVSSLFSSGTKAGNAGSIFIETPKLTVDDFAEISVSNSGTGSAGNIEIASTYLTVQNNGQIKAESNAGDQGNITLKPLGEDSVVVLQNNGSITTNAQGTANGGNIDITTDVLVMLDGSQIVAQAEAGNGGNIDITAQGYLIAADSVISASSAFGLDGVVELKNPNESTVQTVVDLQSTPIDPDSLVANNVCAAGEGSEFVATGRGGVPASPDDFLIGAIFLPQFAPDGNGQYAAVQGWTTDDTGQTVLLADIGAAGQQAYLNGDLQTAKASWLQALQVFQQRGDRRNMVRMLSYLGLAYGDSNDWQRASQVVEETLAQMQQLGQVPNDGLLADVLHNSGIVVAKQGDYERAIQLWVDAARLYDLKGDRLGTLRSVYHQAYALIRLGRERQALELLNILKTDTTIQQDPDLQMAAGILYTHVIQSYSQWQSAENLLKTLLKWSQDNPELSKYKNNILLVLGNLYAQRNQTQTNDINRATDYYQEAATSGNDTVLGMQAELNYLNVLISQNRRLTARNLGQGILPELNKLPLNLDSLAMRLSWASHLRELQQIGGIPESSKQLIELQMERIIRDARQLDDQRSLIQALSILGEWYIQYPYQATQGKTYLQEALALAQTRQEPELLYRLYWRLGQQANFEGKQQQAIANYEAAVQNVQELRQDFIVTSPNQQVAIQKSIKPIYSEFLELLLTANQEGISQKNLQKARSLLESSQLAELDNFFKDACSTIKTLNIDQVDDTAAIIYPIILSERLDLIVALPNQPLKYYSHPVTEQQLENVVKALQLNLSILPLRNGILGNDYQPWAKNLYEWLVAPVVEDLQASGVKTLTFVPAGILRNVPMAVLFDGEQHLIEKYAIAVAPGLQMIESKPLAEEKLQVLTSGLTEARQGFEALPNVNQEIAKISEELTTNVFLNENFTEKAVKQAIAKNNFPIIHFATHGQFSSQLENTFILTWDGRINANELRSLLDANNSQIELLVLSACQTAVGDEYAALGLAGIAVRAGARSTLASLWSVDDRATSELMQQFYKNLTLQQGNRATALQNAQLSLLRNPETQHPFFWASFTLVGSWL